MARRLAGIVTAIGFWSLGVMLLVGAAGALFAATLHRSGSEGWLIATTGTLVLSLAGGTSFGIGWWLAVPRSASRRAPVSDDEMWIA